MASNKTPKDEPQVDAKRKEELERAIRHRVGCEEKAFRIVERLLDNPIENDFLTDCARFINPSHYTDVVEERAIAKQCGYPVCSNPLTDVPKQKYHISMKTNKVYDISDRKNFCSAFCYKASKYYLSQLSTSPVWTRDKDRPPDVTLLPRDTETTSKTSSLVAKDEVYFLPKETDNQSQDGDDDEAVSEKDAMDVVSNDLSTLTFGESVRKERLEQLAKIAADVDSHRRVNDDRRQQQKDSSVTKIPVDTKNEINVKSDASSKKGNECQVKEGVSKDTSEETVIQSASTDTSSSGDPLKSQKVEVVESGIQDNKTGAGTSTTAAKQKKKKPKAKKPKKVLEQTISPLQVIEQVLLEWRTQNTLKYLRGEEDKGIDRSSPVVEDNKASSGDGVQAPAKMEVGQSARRREDLDSDDDSDEEPAAPPSKPVPDMEKLKKETEEFAVKVNEFYYGKPVKGKKQKGSDELVKDVQEDTKDSVITLPPVDSHSQMTIRRKITIDRLNRVLPDILLPMQMSLRDISSDLHQLIRTFNLSSHNITFKPNMWILLGIALLHILSIKNTSLGTSMKQHHQFLSSLLASAGTSVEEISQLATRYQSENS